MTTPRPRVSVVVPSYRGEKWVSHCLDSLAAQTLGYDEYEIVLVQNGPQTGTREVVAAWRTAHPEVRLTYLESEIASVTHARNLALDAATGEYVTFVDDDDRVRPRLLEQLLSKAAPDVVSVVLGAAVYGDNWDSPVFDFYTSTLPRLWATREHTNRDLVPMLRPAWAKLVSLEVARAVRFDDRLARFADDTFFWFSAVTRHHLRLVLTDLSEDAAYLVWMRGGSISARDAAQDWEVHALRTLTYIEALEGAEVDAEGEVLKRIEISNPYLRLNTYLRAHPEDLPRLHREIEQRGLQLVDWERLHDGLPREIAVVEVEAAAIDRAGLTPGHAIARRGRLCDGFVFLAPDSDAFTDALQHGSRVLDRLVKVTNAGRVDWALCHDLARWASGGLESLTSLGREYTSLHSRAAGPLEHFVAACMKLQRPELHWTAEYVALPGEVAAPGEDAPVSADQLLDLIGAAFLQAGFALDEVPERLGDLVRWLVLALADEVVFANDQQRSHLLTGTPGELTEHARSHSAVIPAPTTPRVSVVVPTFRGEGWVLECLDSLAGQSLAWDAFEVVLVQNGEPDRTAELLQRWLIAHPGFQVTHLVTEIGGASHARNLGLEAARGEYLTFVDDDDRVGPRFLEELLAVAAPDRIAVCLTGSVYDEDWAHPDQNAYYWIVPARAQGTAYSNADLFGMLGPICSKLVPTAVARSARFREDLRRHEDTHYWVSVVAAQPITMTLTALSPDAAYLRRIRTGSVTQHGVTLDWDHNVVHPLALVRALGEITITDPETDLIRTRLYDASAYDQVCGYLEASPSELSRVVALMRDLELPQEHVDHVLARTGRALPDASLPTPDHQDGPRVSVVVPTHQGNGWLTDCLDSLAAQTLPVEQFEVLVVRNGPEAGIGALIDRWSTAHPEFPLRLLETETADVSLARNLGIDAARAPYVAFVDDDDRVGPRHLEGLLAKAAPDAVTLVLAGWVYDDAWGRPEHHATMWELPRRLYGNRHSLAEIAPALGSTWAKLVPTPIARDVRFREGLRRHQDTHFWGKLLATHPVRVVVSDIDPAAAYLYRVRSGSATSHGAGTTWERVLEQLTFLEAMAQIEPSDTIGEAEQVLATLCGPAYARINQYLRSVPADIDRVRGELAARGVSRVDWALLLAGVRRGIALISGLESPYDAHGQTAGDRLRQYEIPLDVAIYSSAQDGNTIGQVDRLSVAGTVLGQRLALSGPDEVDWSLLTELAETISSTMATLAQRYGAYDTLLSRAAGPLEHLASALLKIARPELTWTAEYTWLPAGQGAPGDAAAVGSDACAESLLTALARAGVVLPSLPDQMGALARLVACALADELVFSHAAARDAALAGLPRDVADRALTRSRLLHEEPTHTGLQVSVIVPTYEGDAWLAGCLRSLAEQTVPHSEYEIVLVHNGPPNASERIATALLASHPTLQLRHLHSDLAGASHARNLGIEAARAPYVTFVDDDDRVGPRFLEVHLASASPETVTVSAIAMVFDDEFDRPTYDNWLSEDVLGALGHEITPASLVSSLQPATAKVVATEVARHVRFRTDLSMGEDTVFWLEAVARHGLTLRLTEISHDSLYLYHQRSGNTTRQGANWEFHIVAHLLALKALAAVDSADLDVLAARAKLLGRFMLTPAHYLQQQPAALDRFADALAALEVPRLPWEDLGIAVPATAGAGS